MVEFLGSPVLTNVLLVIAVLLLAFIAGGGRYSCHTARTSPSVSS